MRLRCLLLLVVSCLVAHAPAICDPAKDLALEVRATETAFAKTMADRDLESFLRWRLGALLLGAGGRRGARFGEPRLQQRAGA